MNYLKAAAGALAIMMASGMIADYDLLEWDNDIYVTVWSVDDQSDLRLRKHVAAMLPGCDRREPRVRDARRGDQRLMPCALSCAAPGSALATLPQHIRTPVASARFTSTLCPCNNRNCGDHENQRSFDSR